jgi:hypothetical protein
VRAFLTKPLDVKQLLELIDAVADERARRMEIAPLRFVSLPSRAAGGGPAWAGGLAGVRLGLGRGVGVPTPPNLGGMKAGNPAQAGVR